ncbi:hypothetical protein TgHK011_002745 [Trichoderma gracile]|nr:hypothetical protein TgHK011_002745 [Trichoderma gracile]
MRKRDQAKRGVARKQRGRREQQLRGGDVMRFWLRMRPKQAARHEEERASSSKVSGTHAMGIRGGAGGRAEAVASARTGAWVPYSGPLVVAAVWIVDGPGAVKRDEARQGGEMPGRRSRATAGARAQNADAASRGRCSCSQWQRLGLKGRRLPTGGIAGSEAAAQRLSDLDWTGMEKENGGREAGDRVVLGLAQQQRVAAGAEGAGPLTAPLDGPRTGQPRAKNSHCELPGQRRRGLLGPRCGWRGPLGGAAVLVPSGCVQLSGDWAYRYNVPFAQLQ